MPITATSAGSLVRAARQAAGLSQAELSRRAGVTQSVISAYESGGRQPSLPMLARLIKAAGGELDISVRRRKPLQHLTGPLGRRVRQHRVELVDTAAGYDVSNLRVFGSVARGEDGPGSDVDLLADLPPTMGLLGLGRLQRDLERILDARVDLIPANDLKPSVKEGVVSEAVPL